MLTMRQMKHGTSKNPKIREGTLIAKTAVAPARIRSKVEEIPDANAKCLMPLFPFSGAINIT